MWADELLEAGDPQGLVYQLLPRIWSGEASAEETAAVADAQERYDREWAAPALTRRPELLGCLYLPGVRSGVDGLAARLGPRLRRAGGPPEGFNVPRGVP